MISILSPKPQGLKQETPLASRHIFHWHQLLGPHVGNVPICDVAIFFHTSGLEVTGSTIATTLSVGNCERVGGCGFLM